MGRKDRPHRTGRALPPSRTVRGRRADPRDQGQGREKGEEGEITLAATGYTGRLAPSPTGALHLGNVRTFIIAYLRARSRGGRLLFRMEDLDHPRDKPGADKAIVDELRWLGFEWDAECRQSERRSIYRDALHSIRDSVYPCVCTRRDVESAQSAPHSGEQLYYPGTCRGRFSGFKEAMEFAGRVPCWRFRAREGIVAFDDAFAGRYSMDVRRTLGDFPLARDEGGAGYTLACVVDDALSGVTEVVRGDDLLPATPAQMMLAGALGFRTPEYCHMPLVVGPDGKRLAKRHGDTRIASLRASGWTPGRIVGLLAHSCGWAGEDEEIGLQDLAGRFSMETIPRAPMVFNGS